MPVLKCTGVDHVVYAVEYLVPFALVLLDRHGLLLGQFAAAGHHGLLAVDPRRYERRQSARHLLALLAQGMERPDGSFGGAADFTAQIPAAETLVFAAVHVPDLLDHIFIMLDFARHVARIPVFARIVEAEIKFHPVFFSQPQEQIDQIDRRHIAPLLQQVGRRVGNELAVTRSDFDYGIDADGLHMAEVGVPLLFAPILVGDVMRNLIEERARDTQPVLPGNQQGASSRRGGSRFRFRGSDIRSRFDHPGNGDGRSSGDSYFF